MFDLVKRRYRFAIALAATLVVGVWVAAPVLSSVTIERSTQLSALASAAPDLASTAEPVAAAAAPVAVIERPERPKPQLEVAQAPRCSKKALTAPEGALVVGDRVRLRIFEQPVAGDAADELVFERLDLSGEVAVDAQGVITLPVLGPVTAAGRSLGCLSDDVSALYERRFNAPAEVTAGFARRQPVFVTGYVSAPGSFEVSPGMTVLHALALSGGPVAGGRRIEVDPRAAAATAKGRELVRKIADVRLAIARLHAERDEKDDLALSEVEAAALLREVGAARIESEKALLATAIEARAVERELAELDLESLRETERELRGQLRMLEAQAQKTAAITDRLEKLRARGVVAATRLDQEVFREMELLRKRSETDLALLATRRDLRAAERKMKSLGLERRIAVAKELRDAQAALNQLEVELRSNGDILAVARATLGDQKKLRGLVEYKVFRRAAKGQTEIAAVENTVLHPGDVLKVIMR